MSNSIDRHNLFNQNLGESFHKGNYDKITAGFHWSHAKYDNWGIEHRFYLQRTDEEGDVFMPAALRAGNRTLDRLCAAT